MACVSAVSPFVSLSAALGARHFSLITLACLPLIVLSIFKRRWFCRHLCPTGFILEITAPRGRRHKNLAPGFPHLDKWLVVFGIGLAAAGYPILMTFDPLSILGGFLSTWQWKNIEWKVFAPALPLLALIALNIFSPNLWCYRLCPLGAAQEFAGLAGRQFRHAGNALARDNPGFASDRQEADLPHQSEIHDSVPLPGVNRRFFITALFGGMAGWALIANRSRAAVVRPPGAVAEDLFTGLCTRCGNCINVCPESIIVPDFGSSGLRGLLTPVLRYNKAYCNEWCSKCLSACPTMAIRRLSLDQKRALSIGTARIDKSLCLAWSKRQNCMVCQEFCPYQAIAIVQDNGVNCPEMKKEVCRGCGACESQCPAIPARAIVVQGMREQMPLKISPTT